MNRAQKTGGTSRCFAQTKNIKRQSLIYNTRHAPSRFRDRVLKGASERSLLLPLVTKAIEIKTLNLKSE